MEDVFHRYIDKGDAFKVVNYYVILSNTSVEKESKGVGLLHRLPKFNSFFM